MKLQLDDLDENACPNYNEGSARNNDSYQDNDSSGFYRPQPPSYRRSTGLKLTINERLMIDVDGIDVEGIYEQEQERQEQERRQQILQRDLNNDFRYNKLLQEFMDHQSDDH
jgi:hypothetical protein